MRLPYNSRYLSFVLFGARRRSWFREKLIDLVVVGFEGVAHDQKIAAVVRDRVPVDDVGLLSILEIRDSAGATGCAGIRGRNARCVRRLKTVVPFGDAFARGDAEEQAALRI